MVTVEIYSKADCHLCEVAKEVIKNIQQRHTFELKEIFIHEGDEHYNRFKERIPVVYINNKYAFQYNIPEQEFISLITKASTANE